MIKAKTKNFLSALKKEHYYYRQKDEFYQFLNNPQKFTADILSFLNKATLSKDIHKKAQPKFFTVFSSAHNVISWHKYDNFNAVSRLSIQIKKVFIYGVKRNQLLEHQIRKQAGAQKLQFQIIGDQKSKQFEVLLNKVLFMFVQLKEAKTFKQFSSQHMGLFLQFCFLANQKSAKHSIDQQSLNQTLLEVLKYPNFISQYMQAEQQIQQPLFKSVIVGKKQSDNRNKAIQFKPLIKQEDVQMSNQIRTLKARIVKLEPLQDICKKLQLQLNQAKSELLIKSIRLKQALNELQQMRDQQRFKKYEYQQMIANAHLQIRQKDQFRINCLQMSKKQQFFKSLITSLTQENQRLKAQLQNNRDKVTVGQLKQINSAIEQELRICQAQLMNVREQMMRLNELKEKKQLNQRDQVRQREMRLNELKEKNQQLFSQNKKIYKQLTTLESQLKQSQFFQQKIKDLEHHKVLDILKQYNKSYSNKKKLFQRLLASKKN